ncbi:MAG: hypothetical protein ACKOW9_04240 [Candidatus Paceibacterota bacterium]
MPENIYTPSNTSEKIPTINAYMEQVLTAYPRTHELGPYFQEKLAHLKQKLKLLETGEYHEPGAQAVKYNRHTNTLFYELDGEKIKTTLGEVLSGNEWGNAFYLDHASKETKGQNPRELKQTGVIAEKMIQSLLVRIATDRPNLGLEVISANVHQDVELKMDFIVRIQNKEEKGVKTMTIKNVQFTISSDPAKLQIKNEQMNKFKDIVLIQMPELSVNEFYRKWVGQQGVTAGPDIYLNREIEELVITQITS